MARVFFAEPGVHEKPLRRLTFTTGSGTVIFFDHDTRSFVERVQSRQEWWPMAVELEES